MLRPEPVCDLLILAQRRGVAEEVLLRGLRVTASLSEVTRSVVSALSGDDDASRSINELENLTTR